MRLPQSFIRLPLTFDHERIAAEIAQFGEDEWRAHPQRFNGNSSLVLVSTNGEDNDDFSGPMQPAARLEKTPYIRQVMASFDTVIGRSRLMRLAPGASVEHHTDMNYFWRNHLRIHVPVITEPSVAFYCADDEVHMAPGESWTFNNWLGHSVENRSAHARVHLVIDTVGSAELWRMIDGRDSAARQVDFDAADDPALRFESYRGLPVMPPGELRAELLQLVGETIGDDDDAQVRQALYGATRDFVSDWQSCWMVAGPTGDGYPQFKRLLDRYRKQVDALPANLLLSSNRRPVKEAISYTLDAALAPTNLQTGPSTSAAATQRPRFDRPVFIVAAPRSGSTLLFETLARNRELWTVGDETHRHFESIPALRPSQENPSNRLGAEQATQAVSENLLDALAHDLVNSDGRLYRDFPLASRLPEIRFLEKTPKNSLRIPFLLKLFPDARFIFLFRDARQNLSSLLDSWRSRRYVTYPQLPGWRAECPWSHLLVPGWEDLVGRPLVEIVARQWLVTNRTIVDDLAALPRDRWCTVEYDDFLADTLQTLNRLCDFSRIVFGPRMVEVASRPLQASKYTLTPPHPDKWKKNAAELETVLPQTEDLMQTLRALV